MTTEVAAGTMVPMADLERMARAVATSGLFGVKSPEQALALMLVAQAEGRHPALAAKDYDIIQGRPSKKAEAMLRDFLAAGGTVQWHQLDNTIADATFSHPQGGTARIDWTMDRAKEAGMGAKDMWKKFPRQMLRSRVVSEGVRTIYPMATSGMYVPEEVIEFRQEKNITPTAGAADRVSAERQGALTELADKVKGWMAEGSLTDAFLELDNAGLDADEKVYLWTMFDAPLRRQLKEEGERMRVRNAAKAIPAPTEPVSASSPSVISDAQRKLLEARIVERGFERDYIKAHCQKWFGKEHFADLDKEEYKELDAWLDKATPVADEPAPRTAPLSQPSVSPSDATQGEGAGQTVELLTFEQGMSLAELLEEKLIPTAKLLAAAEAVTGDVYLKLDQLPADFYDRAVTWIGKQKSNRPERAAQ